MDQTGTSTNPEPDSEEGLLQESLSGDGLALDTLIERHLPGLRAFVRLRVGTFLRAKESDSDVVQSVCRELLKDLDHFEYQGETRFRHWLYVAVLNKIRQKERYYRAARRDARKEVTRRSEADDSLLLNCYASFCTPSQEVMARESLDQIEAGFQELPEHYREVITLSRLVGLSQEQVAQQMGRSVPSVRNLLTRALVRLAAVLDGSE